MRTIGMNTPRSGTEPSLTRMNINTFLNATLIPTFPTFTTNISTIESPSAGEGGGSDRGLAPLGLESPSGIFSDFALNGGDRRDGRSHPAPGPDAGGTLPQALGHSR